MEPTPLDLKDLLEQARIFISEKMYDDAKKILRRVLIYHPTETEARKNLDEIQRIELDQILQGNEPSHLKKEKTESPEEVLRKLESDFNINVRSPQLEEKFRSVLQTRFPEWSAREKLDLGIAFLVIEFFACACDLFESAARHEDHEIQGNYLHAHALIESGDTSRAVALLEPFLQDLSLTEAVKQDFLYLSGKAFDKMGDLKKAKEYYQKVFTMNPRYRDVASRMK